MARSISSRPPSKFGPHWDAPSGGPTRGGRFSWIRVWISEISTIVSYCKRAAERIHAYPPAGCHAPAREQGRLPAVRGPSRGARVPRRRNSYPEGVGKTTSGKYYSRIVLDGKRYNLGSTFVTPEEASAAYEMAKRDGLTSRPSPKKNMHSRGTGMPLRAPHPHVDALVPCFK